MERTVAEEDTRELCKYARGRSVFESRTSFAQLRPSKLLGPCPYSSRRPGLARIRLRKHLFAARKQRFAFSNNFHRQPNGIRGSSRSIRANQKRKNNQIFDNFKGLRNTVVSKRVASSLNLVGTDGMKKEAAICPGKRLFTVQDQRPNGFGINFTVLARETGEN